MIQQFLVTAFWILSAAISGLAVWRAYRGKGPLVASWTVAVTVAAFSVLLMLLALRIGYVAPIAILQDIIAAQEGLQGHPLPTTDLQRYVYPALDREPVSFELDGLWPRFLEEERQEHALLHGVSEQAHPPFMTLLMAPFVYLLGVRSSFVAMYALSIGMIGVAFLLLHRGLQADLAPSQTVLAIALFLGCLPMYWVLRSGQIGAVICGLIVIAWYCIRNERPLWAGCAIGLAASMKLFPALLFVYLFLRHRKAFVSGIVTMLVLNAVAAGFFGWQSFTDYNQTVAFLTKKYGDAETNWSLLGAIYRLCEIVRVAPSLATVLLMGASAALVIAMSIVVVAKPKQGSAGLAYDREYSLFVAAMPLLSPISWFHYFVVLLLPLAVTAKATLANRVRMGAVIGLFAICVALAAPPSVPLWLRDVVESVSWKLRQTALLIQPLAMMALIVWIARLIVVPAESRIRVP